MAEARVVLPGQGEERLREAIARFREARSKASGIDERPASVYEMLTRERLEELVREVKEVKGEVGEIKKLLVGVFISLALTFLGLIGDIALRSAGVLR